MIWLLQKIQKCTSESMDSTVLRLKIWYVKTCQDAYKTETFIISLSPCHKEVAQVRSCRNVGSRVV